MIIGEATRVVPNIQIPHSQWDLSESDAGTPLPFPIKFNANAVSGDYSPSFGSSNSLLRFLSVDLTPSEELDLDTPSHDFDMPIDTFSSDHFRMFEFKVRKCTRVRSHDWTECPYAHPAEKARRRDPRKYHYSCTACPDFRNGNCKKGDSCDFAHGVFECWLHPGRYRTQLCKDGTNCRRRVCFFAHTPDQLRVLTDGACESSSNGSPIRHAFDPNATFVSSPTSVLNSSQISSLSDSPPTSPLNSLNGGVSFNTVSMNELVSLMGNVQLDNRVPSTSTRVSHMVSVFGSPRGSIIRPGFLSVPSTPTRAEPNSGWDRRYEEEPVMERVESGRDLRARIYAKLSRENSFGGSERRFSDSAPDIGWVSELVK